MKKYIYIIFFIISLQTYTNADSIKDLEIEGMSIGDSLLKHFSKESVYDSLDNKLNYPSSDEFFQIDPFISSKTYSQIAFHIKKNDKKFIIYGIKGSNYYNNNLNGCLEQKKKIINELLPLVESFEETNYDNRFGGTMGRSIAYITDFDASYGSIRVWCSVWDRNFEKTKYYKDSLNVSISSIELLEWLNTEAY